jgi:hypothetical protein
VRGVCEDIKNACLLHKLIQEFKSTHILHDETFSDWGRANTKKEPEIIDL